MYDIRLLGQVLALTSDHLLATHTSVLLPPNSFVLRLLSYFLNMFWEPVKRGTRNTE